MRSLPRSLRSRFNGAQGSHKSYHRGYHLPRGGRKIAGMSIWTRIRTALRALGEGESLANAFAHLAAPPERSAAFAIAVIALGAKMAKADGRVTRDEVAAFRQVFTIPPEHEPHAARIYNLARQDVAGFEAYAKQIKRLFGDAPELLEDLLEGLFHIAIADGEFHEDEAAFIARVGEIFELPEATLAALRARHVPGAALDPYAQLGVAPGDAPEVIRAAWRKAVRDNHPDRLIGMGLPEEAVALATHRLAEINRAWEMIRAGTGQR